MHKFHLPYSGVVRVCALTLISTSAAVADPLPTWTGFYVGGLAGYISAKPDFNVNPTGAWNGFPGQGAAIQAATDGSLTLDGGTFGGQAGFNQQIGDWVLGIEGDLSGTDVSGSRAGGPIAPTGVTSFNQQADLSWMGSVRGRLGITFCSALFYATAGAAFGEWNLYMRMAGGPDAAVFSNSSVQTGWIAGGGAEYPLTEHISIKGEYLYADFGSVSGQSAFFPTSPAFVNDHSIDLSAQVARGGVNYRF